MKRVLFYFHSAADIPALLPVHDRLKRRRDFSSIFSFQPYNPRDRTGLGPEQLKTLARQGVETMRHSSRAATDLAFTAGLHADKLEDCGKPVYVERNLAGRGLYTPGLSIINHFNSFDLACVPGPVHLRRLLDSRRVFIPVTETGPVHLDPLFSTGFASREQLLRQLGLPPGKQVIFYTASSGPDWSAATWFRTRVRHLAVGNRVLIACLDPGLPEEVREAHRRILMNRPNILYVETCEVLPYLRMADVVMGDLHGYALEAAVLGKPVVFIRNPNETEHPDYDPEDIEQLISEAAPVVTTIEEAEEAVSAILSSPGEYSARLKSAGDKLVQLRDGCSAERVLAEALKPPDKLYGGNSRHPEVTVILDAIDTDTGKIRETVESVLVHGGEKPVELVIVTGQAENRPAAELFSSQQAEAVCWMTPGEWVHSGKTVSTEFIACLRAGVAARGRWLFRLINHLRRMERIEFVFPLALYGAPVQDPVNRLGIEPQRPGDFHSLDRHRKHAVPGANTVVLHPPRPDMFAARDGESVRDLLDSLLSRPRQVPGDILPKSRIALDLVAGFDPGEMIDPLSAPTPLPEEQRTIAEGRVAELSGWIGSLLDRTLAEAGMTPVPSAGPGISPGRSSGKDDGHRRLAFHYANRGKLSAARKHLAEALERDPRSTELQALAARIDRREGGNNR